MNHGILLHKLEHYGIHYFDLNFIYQIENNMSILMVFNSDMKGITCGVPQGSVLGPLHFLICTNDLPNISKKLKYYLFADDTDIHTYLE